MVGHPVVALAWGVAVYLVADAHLLGGAMLGAANAAIGAGVAVVARRVASPSVDRAPGV
jgi:hypothetical protein